MIYECFMNVFVMFLYRILLEYSAFCTIFVMIMCKNETHFCLL